MDVKYFYPLILPSTEIDEYMAMDNWLWNNVGEEEIDFEWGFPADYILFKYEEDKVKFILKWL